MIEYEGKTFRTHQEKDEFLEKRELTRKGHLNEFKKINEFNFNQACFSDVGVWAFVGDRPQDPAKLHVFNEPNFLDNIKRCQIFRQMLPEWKWNTEGPKPEFKFCDPKETRLLFEGMIVKLAKQWKPRSKYAGLDLKQMLQAQKQEAEA